jgi:hypothetical protein
MDYVVIYVGIGVIYSIVITLVDQMEVEGHPYDSMNNMDCIMSMVLWPILSFLVIRAIIKTLNK